MDSDELVEELATEDAAAPEGLTSEAAQQGEAAFAGQLTHGMRISRAGNGDGEAGAEQGGEAALALTPSEEEALAQMEAEEAAQVEAELAQAQEAAVANQDSSTAQAQARLRAAVLAGAEADDSLPDAAWAEGVLQEEKAEVDASELLQARLPRALQQLTQELLNAASALCGRRKPRSVVACIAPCVPRACLAVLSDQSSTGRESMRGARVAHPSTADDALGASKPAGARARPCAHPAGGSPPGPHARRAPCCRARRVGRRRGGGGGAGRRR